MPELLKLEGIVAGYGEAKVLAGIDLALDEGRALALLGRNGTGKTTLINTIVGHTRRFAGRITLGGRDLTTLRPDQRAAAGIGWVPQERNIFKSLTVEENLTAVALPGPWHLQRVYDMFPRLRERRANMGNQLSGGEQQMLAIGRALMLNPRVLLLDEPLGALDKKLREETQFELMDLQQELGLTFVIVTHDQDEAMTMADRIAVMDAGKVLQVATPAEIYEAPNSRFVAEFIGSINIFDGEIVEKKGGTARFRDKSGSEFLVSLGANPQVNGSGSLAVRPEKMTITRQRPADAVNAIEGEVWDIAYLGDLTLYNLKLDDGRIIKISMMNSRRTVEDVLTWYDRAWVSFAPDAGVILTR